MFTSTLSNWQVQNNENKTRGIVLVYNSDDWLNSFRETLKQSNQPYIDSQTLSKNITKKKFQSLLGQEQKTIIYDASKHFDSNLFSGLIGSLVGGGLLVLNLPSEFNLLFVEIFENNYQLEDQNITRIFNQITDIQVSELLKRFVQGAITTKQTAIICNDSDSFFPQLPLQKNSQENALEEQSLVIEKICRVCTGHSKRPLVLTAARGRGKSAALGLATKKLIAESEKHIIITAPHIFNLNSFYKHLNIDCDNSNNITTANKSSVRFIAVDKLIKEKPAANLLLIDEAAAIPVQQLEQLTSLYNRIVFSSTTEGYEGNGKGFEIRFNSKLKAIMPQTRFVDLKLPIRWSNNDPLERVFHSTFLLNYPLQTFNETISTEEIEFRLISKAELLSNEGLLSQVFALLVNAHYQTRPNDLERILSDTRVDVFGVFTNQVLIGVCLIRIEGMLSDSMLAELCNGQRQSKGELLPQAIVLNYGIYKLAKCKMARVMRIAVLPELQSKNIGSFLIDQLYEYLVKKRFCFLGASFAVDRRILPFWLKNQFKVFRFGSAKDSSSGNFTCDVIRLLDNSSTNELTNDFMLLLSQFADAFLYKLANQLRTLEREVIFQVLQSIVHYWPVNQVNFDEIIKFSRAQRSLASVDWQIAKWYIFWLSQNSDIHYQENRDGLIIDLIYKGLDWQNIAISHEFTGKKQIIRRLRSELKTMFQNK